MAAHDQIERRNAQARTQEANVLTETVQHFNVWMTVRLNYRHDALFLEVHDDGEGIDPVIMDAGGKPGHWGLMGMRERAKQMSAKLSIESPSGSGTRVTLCIPARIAYATLAKTRRFIWSKQPAP
jgi:nitrate/nitrite-specific signal transduction histidine kinase